MKQTMHVVTFRISVKLRRGEQLTPQKIPRHDIQHCFATLRGINKCVEIKDYSVFTPSSFLGDCDIMVLYDQRNGTADVEALLRLGQPVVVVGLSADENSNSVDTLTLPDEAQFPGASDCPAYFIISEKVSKLFCIFFHAGLFVFFE